MSVAGVFLNSPVCMAMHLDDFFKHWNANNTSSVTSISHYGCSLSLTLYQTTKFWTGQYGQDLQRKNQMLLNNDLSP